MAIRQDKVQLSIEFITDESRALAKTLLTTKQYNAELAKSTAVISQYQRELAKVGSDEAKRAPILAKIAAEEKKIADNLARVAAEGKKVEALDLNKVAPAQLVERAKQLQAAMRLIPQTAPQFRELQAELARVNGQLKNINDTSKGISAASGAAGGGLFQRILGVAGGIGVFQLVSNAIRSLADFGRRAIAEVDAQLKVDAQVKEAIRSTAGIAGRSLQDLKSQADDLENVTLFGADQTGSAQALLLTFTNIRTEIFDQTIPLVQDLSTAFKQDLSSSAIQVGKALNDPIKGVTALQRVGISFTEDQKKMIASLVETGDVAGAQRIILKELETQVGGSARAAALAGAGPWQQLVNVFGQVTEAAGALIVGGLNSIAPLIKSITLSFVELISVPVSQTLERERQSFNGVSLQIQNANVGSKNRTELIRGLIRQYPEFLRGIDAEKVTNEQLRPILDKINQSYIVRIALQKQQEKIQPLLEREADTAIDLAEKRAKYNIELAKGAELAGINLRNIEGEANQVKAVTEALEQKVKSQGRNFSFTASEEAIALNRIRSQAALNLAVQQQENASNRVKNAETERLAVVEQLKKTYGDLVDEAQSFSGSSTPTGGTEADTGGGSGPVDKVKKEADAAEGSLAFLRKQISDLQKEIETTPGDSKALAPLLEQLNIAERALKALEDRIAALKNPKVELPPTLEDIERQLGAGTSSNLGEFGESELLQHIGLNEAKLAEDEKYFKNLGDLRTRDSEANIKNLEGQTEDEADERRKRLQFAATIAESLASSFFKIQADQLQQETEANLKALNDEFEQRRKLAGDDKVALARLDDEFERKKATIERQAAERRKKAAISEAIIAGALAVVKSLPNVFAAIAAGVAAAAQIAIISNQKFDKGGFTGRGFGSPDSSGFKPAGIVHAGEYVAPAWQVNNPETGPVVQWLNNRRLRGYATGGFVAPNTTPSDSIPINASTATSIQGLDSFMNAVTRFEAVVARFPREVKSRVVYTEIEDAGTELNTVRDDASI